MTGPRALDERGVSVGGIAAFAIVLAVMAGLAGVTVAGAAAARQATTAADLGALAGARAQLDGGDPCRAADELVRANRGRLDGCAVRGQTVHVEVSVGLGLRAPGFPDRARATANAAPVG